MLFCYPVAAVADNWLHDCIIEMLSGAISALRSGGEAATWPECIPCPHRENLQTRTSLEKAYIEFCAAAQSLLSDEKELILSVIWSQNNIPYIFKSEDECPTCDALPISIIEPAKKLFQTAFKLLTDLGLRDDQYRIIYESIPDRVCPFCGCEFFDAPGAPRHDLDHFLLESRYPFAGANLRNLVPAGGRCNTSYKLRADILVGIDGIRRRCFDPYGSMCASVSLLGSKPFARSHGRLPEWNVDLGSSPEASTWDAVWHIKERYGRDVLDAEYSNWLSLFAQWCKRRNLRLMTSSDISDTLDEYVKTVIQEGFADRAFLKKAMFEMIRDYVQSGEEADRLTFFLIDLVSPDRGAAA
jgi:hypothetical protein